jgi:hypothetical protein
VEVTVTDDEIAKSATVDVAALRCQLQQARVDQQFLEPVGVATGGVAETLALSKLDVLALPDSNVPNGFADREDVSEEITHDRCPGSRRVRAQPRRCTVADVEPEDIPRRAPVARCLG